MDGFSVVRARANGGYEFVDDDRRLAECLAEADGVSIYAIDTEFHRENTYYPKLGLVQVAWPGRLLLVDPLACSLNPLKPLLSSTAVALMHAGAQDLEILARTPGEVPTRMIDTQTAARFCGMSSPSLSNTLRRFLRIDLPKGDRMTNWLKRPLSPGQLDYAASDVRHLIPLWEALSHDLTSRGRLGWAKQECERMRLAGSPGRNPEEAWMRVKEARRLRGEALARAAAVAEWRERRAERLNILPRYVLSDLGVAALGQNPMRTKGDLATARGVNTGAMSNKTVTELLEVLRKIQDTPAKELPRVVAPKPRTQPSPAVKLVSSWLAQAAADISLDPPLVASISDVEDFLRGEPGAALASGWRFELFGAKALSIRSGEASVALGANGMLTLEERSGRPL